MQNRCLNWIKLIACALVCFCHIQFPGKAGEAVATLHVFAVPFFYMIAGYFVDIEGSSKKILGKIKKNGILFISAFLLYIVYEVLFTLFYHRFDEFCQGAFSLNSLKNIMLINSFVPFGCGHLWFMPPLIECYILVYLINKSGKNGIVNLCYKLLPLFWIISFIGKSFHILDGRMFLFSAWPYFLTANYIKNKKIEDRINTYVLLTVILLQVVYRECALFYPISNDFVDVLMVYIFSLSVFIVCVKNPNFSIGRIGENFGKKYSMYIYVFHILVQYILYQFANHWRIIDNFIFLWTFPIAVLIISLFLGAVVDWILVRLQFKKNG